MEDYEIIVRAISLYVAGMSKPDSGSPEQIIDRAEIFYNWIINGDDKQ